MERLGAQDTAAVGVDREALARLEMDAERMARKPDCGSGKLTPKPNGAAKYANPVLVRLQELRAQWTPEMEAESERKRLEMQAAEEREEARERERQCQRLLRESGVPEPRRELSLARLHRLPHQADARAGVEELVAAVKVKRATWWLVLQGRRNADASNPGGNGIGKSALGMAAVSDCCRAGRRAEFWTEARLTRALFAHLRGNALESFVEGLINVPLLVLDNLGTDGDFSAKGVAVVQEFLRAQLFDVLDARCEEERPVCITTNLDPDEFESRYGHDIYSRVYGMTERRASWIALAGPDLRKGWGR